MATAPTEVVKTGHYYADYYSNNVMMFEIAKVLSASAHFNIIDSYSNNGSVRYKGDPIANSIWQSSGDVGQVNSWFVIECQTEHPLLTALGYSGLPKWQMKFQWVTRYNFLADVSDPTGVKYPKNHGAQYYQWMRFAPWGGWDLADTTPDFNPVSGPAGGVPSSGNHEYSMEPGYIMLIMANGCLHILQHNSNGTITDISAIVGDVLPPGPVAMPNPRAQYGSGNGSSGIGITQFMSQDGNWSSTSDYATIDPADGGFAFWDENEDLIETTYRTARNRALVQKIGNKQATGFELETLPLIVIPHKSPQGARFAFGHIRMGYGKGLVLYDSKTLMTAAAGYTPVFPWDGVSAP